MCTPPPYYCYARNIASLVLILILVYETATYNIRVGLVASQGIFKKAKQAVKKAFSKDEPAAAAAETSAGTGVNTVSAAGTDVSEVNVDVGGGKSSQHNISPSHN